MSKAMAVPSSLLVSFLLLLLTSSTTAALECASGHGTSRVIPEDWINDGFCDCPFDAADELQTNACSGSTIGWAGMMPPPAADDDDSSSSIISPPRFACPQQPKLKLPLSRINDGICDCCDGADEVAVGSTPTSSSCPDICDQVLAAERAARAKLLKDYEIGTKKRMDALEQYAQLEMNVAMEIERKEEMLSLLTTNLDQKRQKVESIQLQYMNQRRRLVLQTIQQSGDNDGLVGDILKHLSVEELALLIQYTCQLNAEMDETTTEDTCVSLRLAGVDVGLVWDRELFHKGTATLTRIANNNSEQTVLLAKMVHHNADGDPIYLLQDMERKQDNNKKDRRPNRRRLDDIYDDDYMNDDYTMEEEEEEEEDSPPPRRPRNNNNNSNKRKERHGKRKELQDMIEASPLSKSRKLFLAKSDVLLEKMEAVLSEDNNDNNNSSEEGEEDITPPGGNVVDPMALTMGQTTLRTRQKRVEKGFDWAVSAKILIDAVMQQEDVDQHQIRTDLWNLAGATLFYADVSVEHVWQMIMLLSSFEDNNNNNQEEESSEDEQQPPTCASPLADLCARRGTTSSTRNGIPYPPEAIQKAGEAACQRAVDEVYTDICPPDEENDNSASSWPNLSIPQGLYGYYTVDPRSNTDPLELAFAAWDELEDTQRPSTGEAEEELSQLEKQQKELEEEIASLDDSIGGRESHKFGDKGELHPFHEQCFSIDAGKYTYEICPFAKAHQRDVGQKRGGTSLGSWVGMEYNEVGERVLKWDKGQKCWNGPNRSVSAIVRCGAENKVLTADEPQTCTYLLEMESFIACDEAFYNKHIA